MKPQATTTLTQTGGAKKRVGRRDEHPATPHGSEKATLHPPSRRSNGALPSRQAAAKQPQRSRYKAPNRRHYKNPIEIHGTAAINTSATNSAPRYGQICPIARS